MHVKNTADANMKSTRKQFLLGMFVSASLGNSCERKIAVQNENVSNKPSQMNMQVLLRDLAYAGGVPWTLSRQDSDESKSVPYAFSEYVLVRSFQNGIYNLSGTPYAYNGQFIKHDSTMRLSLPLGFTEKCVAKLHDIGAFRFEARVYDSQSEMQDVYCLITCIVYMLEKHDLVRNDEAGKIYQDIAITWIVRVLCGINEVNLGGNDFWNEISRKITMARWKILSTRARDVSSTLVGLKRYFGDKFARDGQPFGLRGYTENGIIAAYGMLAKRMENSPP